MKTCLICDDHALVRDALAGLLRLHWPGATSVQARTFPEAWDLAKQQPEICIVDLVMPGADPITGIAGIRSAAPDCKLLVLTGTQDDDLMLDLFDLEIDGFAPKTVSSGIVEAALRLILAGGRYLPDRFAALAAARTDQPSIERHSRNRTPSQVGARLTERQLDILRRAATGASTKEIAIAIGVAPSTVKTHLMHIQNCLGARNRMEATARARELGLL